MCACVGLCVLERVRCQLTIILISVCWQSALCLFLVTTNCYINLSGAYTMRNTRYL